MHLQRVQVPDFRVLKDVDITFEKDFSPRVFPLGSQNGGGKSTLLQLIFVLLHCSTNPSRHFAIKNLLNGFTLRKGEDKRVLAIVDIWNGEKTIQLEFFVCGDTYIQKKYNAAINESEKTDLFLLSFYLFARVENLQQKINGFEKENSYLKDIIEEFGYRNSDNTSFSFMNSRESLKKRLSNLGFKFDSLEVDFSDPDSLNKTLKEIKVHLSNRHEKLKDEQLKISKLVYKLIESLKSDNIKYITYYAQKDIFNEIEIEALLCNIPDEDHDFLECLSNKVFLSAPSTQVFLFLNRNSRKSLFTSKSTYLSDLISANSDLSGLFTYDFLATDILIQAFKNARDTDFKEALKTGEYGNNYKKLLQDLDFLLNNKQVNLMDDFSGLTFKLDRFKDSIELYPEDLSHGELKRLSVYVWLKYKNIEDSIVLMDEVDLALHPDWQYQIVSDLIDWSASNQYVLATHSYELCNALTPSHVKILEPKLTERRSD